jgi:dethiobiotin synthetase
MSKNIFITGTGTEIGKTYVTGLIIKKLTEISDNVAYFKAAMSGNDLDKDNNIIPGDASLVKKLSGINQPLNEMCPYLYEKAYSPHLASNIEGNPVDLNVVKNKFEEISEKYDYITMEGSGGIICPIRFDENKIQLEDIIKTLNLSCIIVADAGLGTINNVVLTIEYMKNKKIPIKGIILNNFHPGDIMEEDNLKMCEYLTGIKVLCCVKQGDTDLDIDLNKLTKLYE